MNESFYTGKGIGVAILDTGIYPHIDFDSRICAFADFIAHKKVPYDDNGHGTCVAGILAGSGRASMGKYKGMAPGSRIAALKVLDRFGNGNKEDVLQAFRWILQNRERYSRRPSQRRIFLTDKEDRRHSGDVLRREGAAAPAYLWQ